MLKSNKTNLRFTIPVRIIPLFQLKAAQYVREHITCMYSLLPMMKGANRRLLKTAIEELVEVHHGDKETVGDFIAYMVVLLERVKTIAPLEKAKMKEVLDMYHSLWDQSPIIQKMKAASEAEGEVKGLRKALINVVRIRFPRLTELAQERAEQITDAEKLTSLHEQILTAPDEASVRLLLAPTVA